MAKRTGVALDEKAFAMAAGAILAAASLFMGAGMGMYSWGMMRWMFPSSGPLGMILWPVEAAVIGAALGYAFARLYNAFRA
ncbi:MAG: hypothetical protein J4431_03095 [Candidatus Aenigmarchaeota archaeon]|nr:hypothetical protein [Candidatus Aenigmarchaeota archaeon]